MENPFAYPEGHCNIRDMSKAVGKAFLSRVSDVLPDLHPSERKLADLILDFPGEMAGYTATEIAELALVSNATVSRFVRRLGYHSFDEARRAVREEQKSGTALLRMSTRKTQISAAVAAHFETSQQNLDLTYGALDGVTLDEFCKAMIAAPRVWFVGFRAGQPLAQYMGWQTSQVLPHVTVLPRAGETLAESLVSIAADDVVVLMALRRAPKLIVQAAQTIIRSGSKLAVIEDRPTAFAENAQWRFSCATSTPGPLMNHVGAMALCNLVSGRVIELAGTSGRSRMAAIEESHRLLDEL